MSAPIFLPGKPDVFQNYLAAIQAAGGTLLCSEDSAGAAGCRGLLVPGGGDMDPALYGQADAGSISPDPALDRRELALIRQFAEAGLPILGICRGAQLLNAAFGGTLIQDLPGHSKENGTDRLHPIRAASGSRLARLYGERFTVNSAHHQAAGRIGRGFGVTARAADGVVEAMEHRTLPILAVQFHPERLTGALRREGAVDGAKIFDLFLSLCTRGVL